MKYSEVGFRPFYHNFCAVPIKKNLKGLIKDFPGGRDANGILTYGYYDRDAGLTLAVLAAAHIEGDKASFEDPNNSIMSMIRIGAVADDEVLFFSGNEGNLKERYAEKLEMLHHYDAEEEVEKSREFEFLDGSRHETCIDDVLVYIVKEGLQPEGCWVRITGLMEDQHVIVGTLLNEPNQDFGYHEGETVAFFVHKDKDGKIICISDMNPSASLTEEDLADGHLLEEAIHRFNEERNEANFVDVLELLRDSFLWVPCTAVLSDEDMQAFERLLEENKDNLEAIVGMEGRSLGETRMIPDILQNGDNYFFPGFTTDKAMGEYGNSFSKVQSHMLQIINLARNNDKDVAGIVINAFSEPFVLDKDIWDLVENMKSRIVKIT